MTTHNAALAVPGRPWTQLLLPSISLRAQPFNINRFIIFFVSVIEETDGNALISF